MYIALHRDCVGWNWVQGYFVESDLYTQAELQLINTILVGDEHRQAFLVVEKFESVNFCECEHWKILRFTRNFESKNH